MVMVTVGTGHFPARHICLAKNSVDSWHQGCFIDPGPMRKVFFEEAEHAGDVGIFTQDPRPREVII